MKWDKNEDEKTKKNREEGKEKKQWERRGTR